MLVLETLALGSPTLAAWATLCANVARDAVKMLADKPAPIGVDVGVTQRLFGSLLAAAGQARPRYQAHGHYASDSGVALTLVVACQPPMWLRGFSPSLRVHWKACSAGPAHSSGSELGGSRAGHHGVAKLSSACRIKHWSLSRW